MSSNTSVSPVSIPNPCKCGHDYLQHVAGSVSTAYCMGCQPAGSSFAYHVHQFTSVNEAEPSFAFQSSPPRGYYVSGGIGTYFQGKTTLTSSQAANATNITVASSSGAVVGGTMLIRQTGNDAADEEYQIVAVPDATHVTIAPPGLSLGTVNGSSVSFYGRRGSTFGAGLPPNGQRAG